MHCRLPQAALQLSHSHRQMGEKDLQAFRGPNLDIALRSSGSVVPAGRPRTKTVRGWSTAAPLFCVC